MAILINDTAPRAQYTATSGQTVFTVPFEFFENADLKVYKNSVLLTITTQYTVSGAGVTGGGSITLVTGATTGDVITIVRDIPVKRVTDFPSSGPFNVNSLNTELDKIVAMVQEREDDITRVVQLSETDTSTSLTLPVASARASKVLGFDTTGNLISMQEIGNYRGNWAASTAYILRDLIKDTTNNNIYICVAAHTSSGSLPISTNVAASSWALIVDAAAAATSAAQAASLYDQFDDRYLGSKASNPSVDNDGNALLNGALYFNTTSNEMRVYDGTNWKIAFSGGSITTPTSIDVSSSSAALRVTQTGAGNSLVVEDSTNPDSSPFVVDATGNVGIGVSAPTRKLDINGTAYINGTFEVEGQTLFKSVVEIGPVAGEGGEIRLYNPSGSSIGASFDCYTANVGRLDADTFHMGQLSGPSGGEVIFFTETTAKMWLKAGGNLGIGTDSPGSKLDVKGSLRLSGSTSGYVGLAPAAAAGSVTYTLPSADGSTGQVLSTNGSGGLSWVANGGAGSMVYPGAGIPVSTGSAWGTSLTAPSGAIVGTTDTQTLTNKRVNPRVLASTANSATPTINTDQVDMVVITGQSVAITSFTTNLSGTPVNGQKLWISITGTTAIAITSWGASFEASTVSLPTSTVGTNRLDVGFVWNAATSKWRCVAVA